MSHFSHCQTVPLSAFVACCLCSLFPSLSLFPILFLLSVSCAAGWFGCQTLFKIASVAAGSPRAACQLSHWLLLQASGARAAGPGAGSAQALTSWLPVRLLAAKQREALPAVGDATDAKANGLVKRWQALTGCLVNMQIWDRSCEHNVCLVSILVTVKHRRTIGIFVL